MPAPSALSALSRPELEALLVELFDEVVALKQVVAEQRVFTVTPPDFLSRSKTGQGQYY